MKKTFSFVLAICIMLLFTASFAFAGDIVLSKEIKSVTFKKDKNGQEYARFIINENRTLNGIAYTKDVTVMAFGDQVQKAKALRKGQTLHAIASEGDYRGNKTYTVIDFVKH